MSTSPFDSDRGPEIPRRRGGKGRGKGRGDGRRRSDPNATVPDAHFDSYYGRQIVKPAPWGHEIPAYFFLGGLAGGSGIIGAWASVCDLDVLRRRSRFAALAAVGASGVALVADLGKPQRFLNMLRTVKLTSPMSVGTWIFSAFAACAGVAVACEGAEMLGLRDDGGPGDSIVEVGLNLAEPLSMVGSAAFAAPLAAYTAVLLSDTATPLWHDSYRELPFLFTASALGAASGLAMVTTPPSQTRDVRQLAVGAAATDVIAFHLMKRRLGELAEPLEHGRPGTLATVATVCTISGALGAAFLGRNRAVAVLSGLALMAGSACTRFAVVEAGIESAKDPRYTVISQKARLAARRARGKVDDAITTVKRTAGRMTRTATEGAS